MMRILGIDPGASGAIALLDTEQNVLTVVDMPVVEVRRGSRNVRHVSAQALSLVVDALQPIDHAVVERVHSMPGQGVASTFAFGRAFGVCEGVLAGANVRYTDVAPATWMRAMYLTGGKDSARHMAMQLFPDNAERFARKKDDGRADATLLAVYGSRVVA
jgi:crossover junction endodeoxyribonuclease RuvC